MKNLQKPTWVTIADDKTKKLPAGKKRLPVENDADKVNHKAFWAAGFIALLVFSFALALPQQITGFIKAELFDGEFENLVPAQDDNVFFSESDLPAQDPVEEPVESLDPIDELPFQGLPQNSNGIEAESEAVSFEIDPIDEPEVLEDVPLTDEEEVLLDANPEPQPIETQEPEVVETPQESAINAELQALLENLNSQLDELKKDNQEKAAEIEALMFQVTNNQYQNLHGAANSSNNSNSNTAGIFSGEGQYRYNTHTVTVNPYDVLAQNRQAASQINQLALQANMTQSTPDAYQNNAALSGVQGQPTTGPVDVMLLALILTAVSVLSFGIYRSVKVA